MVLSTLSLDNCAKHKLCSSKCKLCHRPWDLMHCAHCHDLLPHPFHKNSVSPTFSTFLLCLHGFLAQIELESLFQEHHFLILALQVMHGVVVHTSQQQILAGPHDHPWHLQEPQKGCLLQNLWVCCNLSPVAFKNSPSAARCLSRSSRAMRDFLLFSLCHIQPN